MKKMALYPAAVLLVLVLSLDLSVGKPLVPKGTPSSERPEDDVERSLDRFLDLYYSEYLDNLTKEVRHAKTRAKNERPPPEDDIYETMQGDQPVANNVNQDLEVSAQNSSDVLLYSVYRNTNYSGQYIEAARNRPRVYDLEARSKENFLRFLKKNILEHLGRSNASMSKPEDVRLASSFNISVIPNFLNSTNMMTDDLMTTKIRSFYPSCDLPVNTDQDVWKDDDMMNLYFNFDYDRNANISTATLRLYRLPENGTAPNSRSGDCDNSEEEKLLRVSIYWYTKSLKKRRGVDLSAKKRLSDSKVVPLQANWVELSVKPATKAWTRGRNLGLGVHVEDQEGNTLRADKYFKGASCMVGASTPKPIPTIVSDAARKSNELDRLNGHLGGNSTAADHRDVPLLPIIDVCTLEYPENYSQSAEFNECDLRHIREQPPPKEHLERVASLPDILASSSRHIRHQRQYLANKKANNEGSSTWDFDPRSRIVGSRVVMTNAELQDYTNKLNFSTVNR